MDNNQQKEPFICSGCKEGWCDTPTSVCVPDITTYEESNQIDQEPIARVLITSTKFDLLRRLCEENDETIQEYVEQLIEKENFDRHYTYDGLSGQTYQKTCLSHKCMMKSQQKS